MANNENLIRNEDLTPEERSANASKAGKASVKKRRERRLMQETAKIVLSMPYEGIDEELDDLEKTYFEEWPDKKFTVGERAVLKVAHKAMRGDIAAITFLRDTAGEKPVEQVEINADVAKAEEDIKRMIAERRAKEDAG